MPKGVSQKYNIYITLQAWSPNHISRELGLYSFMRSLQVDFFAANQWICDLGLFAFVILMLIFLNGDHFKDEVHN